MTTQEAIVMSYKMNLKEIYQDKKKVLDYGYSEWWNEVYQEIENDDDYTLASDEVEELVVDLMLSNVLGEVVTFEDTTEALKQYRERENNPNTDNIEMLQRENKAMAGALLKLGYTNEQISDVCNGAI